MDAIQQLVDDHNKVRDLFKQFSQLGHPAIAQEICRRLTVHSTLEEEIVYPVLRDRVDAGMADEAEEEHAQVKELIEEIETMDEGEELENAMAVLEREVEHHVEEEEGEVFPKLEAELGPETLELGRELFRRRQDLLPET